MMHLSHSLEDTQKFARAEAQKFMSSGKGEPLVIALEGELGAGKTTFTQAFAKALGAQGQIKSPTFVLMKSYELTNAAPYHTLHHLDCYRLQKVQDLGPLGVAEKIVQSGTITLIEWAERVKEILPRNYWLIRFEHVSEHERNISITHLS